MSNKTDVVNMIEVVEKSLNDTQTAANASRGVLNDVANLVIPMQKDQLAILRKIAEGLPD